MSLSKTINSTKTFEEFLKMVKKLPIVQRDVDAFHNTRYEERTDDMLVYEIVGNCGTNDPSSISVKNKKGQPHNPFREWLMWSDNSLYGYCLEGVLLTFSEWDSLRRKHLIPYLIKEILDEK